VNCARHLRDCRLQQMASRSGNAGFLGFFKAVQLKEQRAAKKSPGISGRGLSRCNSVGRPPTATDQLAAIDLPG
jgi:hypothetical protein